MIDISHLKANEWYTALVNELEDLQRELPEVKWVVDKNGDGLLKLESTNLRNNIRLYWDNDANIICLVDGTSFLTENCTMRETCEEIKSALSLKIVPEKAIRDGKVAVILNRSGKWFSEHEIEDLLYCPPLVEVLLKEDYDYSEVIQSLLEFGCELKTGDTKEELDLVTHLIYKDKEIEIGYSLVVQWVKEGTIFRVDWLVDDEQEVWEIVEIFNQKQWLTA